MPRKKNDPAIRQKEFTDAAERLFFEKGYDATTVQDVLKAVGGESLSPSVFYYYFPSKEDLFEATIAAYVSHYIEGIGQILSEMSLSLSNKLQNIIKEIAKSIDHFLQVEAYFINDKGYSRQVYRMIAQNMFSGLIDPTQRLIEDSINNGLLPESHLLTVMDSRRMAYLLLYASYSLFHKEDEANYLDNVQEALTMLPAILEQILGLPVGSLGE